METMETNGVQKKSNGALVGSIIVIIILILGGIYLVKMRASQIQQPNDTTANSLSSGDDLGNIQTDLDNNANIYSLDINLQ